MRQKIARLVHHVDSHFAIGYAHVHVQSKNEIRAGEQLHVLNDLLVTLALGDVLVPPVRKRVGANRRDFEPALPASSASLLRRSITCVRACSIESQISVPSSTTDWCISGLICSLSTTLPPSRIS